MAHTGQFNRQTAGSWTVVGLLVVMVLFSSRLCAQDENAGSQPTSADTPSPDAGLAPQQPTLELQQPTDVSDENQDERQRPVVRSLETGLPLRSVVSPLRWGHLSLLSFTAFSAYDNNYPLQGVGQSSLGSQLTVVQGLLVYSIQRAHWSTDLQYQPYIWFSPQSSHADFAAHAVDFNTAHNFASQWRLNVTDSYRYSPALANSLGPAFSTDFSSSTASSNPFLSTGRKLVLNSANLELERPLNERSKLSFTLTDTFISLSVDPNNQPGITSFGIQQKQHAYGPGMKWSRHWNSRNTISLLYNYRRQTYPGATGSNNFQTAEIGYNRVLKPSLTATLQVGPGWSNGTSPGAVTPYRQTTLQGFAELFKQFTNGGVALSFQRNSEFSGIISNSYGNRYNLAITRRFLTRCNAELSASYVQQEFVGKRTTSGELGFVQLGYRLGRSWSLFTSYRYFNTSNAGLHDTLFGPQQIVSVGIRWAWEAEGTTRK